MEVSELGDGTEESGELGSAMFPAFLRFLAGMAADESSKCLSSSEEKCKAVRAASSLPLRLVADLDLGAISAERLALADLF